MVKYQQSFNKEVPINNLSIQLFNPNTKQGEFNEQDNRKSQSSICR
ncbi:hypothetical protein MTBBW1_600057 [Desulfamplus magnetovallimortis]|uniref:Uncharacterized protein n=1 Tax=Desulfamplus magnetovallimortis TaxID=1246637 RepID=A0A1W1HI91_9BACT|nr:hypothetical protein MTBBW1_600057 [Desulfamplus magnetovallimortis]